jgi:hypothetical protein
MHNLPAWRGIFAWREKVVLRESSFEAHAPASEFERIKNPPSPSAERE